MELEHQFRLHPFWYEINLHEGSYEALWCNLEPLLYRIIEAHKIRERITSLEIFIYIKNIN